MFFLGFCAICCFNYLVYSLAERAGESGCCVACCLAPTSLVALRTKIRTMYGIKVSIFIGYYGIKVSIFIDYFPITASLIPNSWFGFD